MLNNPPASHWAARTGERDISYPQLRQDIETTRQWLHRALGPEVRAVGVAITQPYEHWVCTLALLELGLACASVTQPHQWSKPRQQAFDGWICDTVAPGLSGRVVVWRHGLLEPTREQGESSPAPLTLGEGSEGRLQLRFPATAQRWLFTSGTTGQPKRVVITAQELQMRLQAAALQYGDNITAHTRMFTLMGLDTIGALLATLFTWVRGGCVLFAPPTVDGRLNVALAIRRSNFLTSSPARLQEVLNQSAEPWFGRAERTVRAAGSRLSAKLRDQVLRQLAGRVQSSYGSTELGMVASCDASLLDRHPGAAGTVYPNVEVQVVDEQGCPLPDGQSGRIRCRAPGMATGYAGQAASEQFQDGWFYSGDWGYMTEDQLLVVNGRDNDVINLGGAKFSALDWESALQQLEGIRDVCVVALPAVGPLTVAVVVVADGGADLPALSLQVKPLLPAAAQIKLVSVPSLPKNAMGKLLRMDIAQRVQAILSKGRS